jgi:hypothetical protein
MAIEEIPSRGEMRSGPLAPRFALFFGKVDSESEIVPIVTPGKTLTAAATRVKAGLASGASDSPTGDFAREGNGMQSSQRRPIAQGKVGVARRPLLEAAN